MAGIQKAKKGARKCVPKNRYCAAAKLSEHKFLRILQGFSEGLTIEELEQSTHVSGRTIRTTYRNLRSKLFGAACEQPKDFGGAGLLLFDDGEMRESGKHFLNALHHSRYYRQHQWRHLPRLRCPLQEQHLLLETTMRILCALDLRGLDQEAENWEDGVLQNISTAIGKLHPRQALQTLADHIPLARPHQHATHRLFADFRRYLLNNPL